MLLRAILCPFGLVLVLFAMVAALPAYGEEVVKRWKTDAAPGREFATEREVQRAIENAVAPDGANDQPLRWHVVKTWMSAEQIKYWYRFKPIPLIVTPWKYRYVNTDYDSLDAMLEAIRRLNASPLGCPPPTVTLSTWATTSTGAGGNPSMLRAVATVGRYIAANGLCVGATTTANVYQVREVRCPHSAALDWKQSIGACDLRPSLEPYARTVMTYTTTLITNQCRLGNPCEPTTGNKTQSESDLELDWIQFVRYFNSMTSVPSAGLGPNWSHSHSLRLAIANEADGALPGRRTVGLVEADGSHVPFTWLDHFYVANNSSGDRIEDLADYGWVLYTANEMVVFDQNGWILRRMRESGSELSYVHDTTGRLLSVTHGSGRVLLLHYEIPGREELISAISSGGIRVATYSYNDNGQLTGVEYGDTTKREYHYEDSRFPYYLTGVTAEDGRRFSWFGYDEKGRVICSRHSSDCNSEDVGIDGVRLRYTADGATVVTDSLGRVTTYGLSSSVSDGYPRKVTSVADSLGQAGRKYYTMAEDFRRRLHTVVDQNGVTTRYQYSQAEDPYSFLYLLDVTTVIEAEGTAEQRTTETHTSVPGNRMVYQKVGSLETRVLRNARQQPTRVIMRDLKTGEVRTTRYTYCESVDVAAGGDCPILGLLKSVDGPREDVVDVTRYRYHNPGVPCSIPEICQRRKGDVSSITNAMGHVFEINTYDPLGRPTESIDGNDLRIARRYTRRGLLEDLKQIGPAGLLDYASITYWPTGLPRSVDDLVNGRVDYFYDSAQRITDLARNNGRSTIHYLLDDAGNRLREDFLNYAGISQGSAQAGYNESGRLTSLSDAYGNKTSFSYNNRGRVSEILDPAGTRTLMQYDSLGRVVGSVNDVEGLAVNVSTAYDQFDRVVEVVDPKGLLTSYSYNAFGDLVGLNSPDSGQSAYSVDPAGNVLTRTDSRGVTVSYAYDSINRVTSIDYPDPSMREEYVYDVPSADCAEYERYSEGRLSFVRHSGGTSAYCYNSMGDVTRKMQNIGGVSIGLSYGYKIGGSPLSITYPDGSIVESRIAGSGYATIDLTRNGSARRIVSVDRQAAFGNMRDMHYSNSVRHNKLLRPLDQNLRPMGVWSVASGGSVTDPTDGLSIGLTYDAVGKISAIGSGSGNLVARYEYDALGRLVETKDGASGSSIESYRYDETGNRTSVATAAGVSYYQYAPNSHRLIDVDGESREYDGVGNTLSIGSRQYLYNSANRLREVREAGSLIESYLYNHKGERIQRRLANGDVEFTLYDEDGRWMGAYGSGGDMIQQAVWLEQYPVALMNRPSEGVPALAYVQADHVGTPRAVVDADRDVVIWNWSNASEVFGNQVPNTDPDLDGKDFEVALRFPGQQANPSTGLFYNYQREYDPVVGRYTQSDPIGLNGGISTYVYAEGDPLSTVDPLGLEGVGYWNNGERNTVTGAYAMNDCESEAAADLVVDLIPLTATVGLAMDVLGIDFNFKRAPYVEFGQYGVKTPFAAAGHGIEAAASQAEARAAHQMKGAAAKGIHYSVANGRRNRAAANVGRAMFLRAGARYLGPFGAAVNFRTNWNNCQCPPK